MVAATSCYMLVGKEFVILETAAPRHRADGHSEAHARIFRRRGVGLNRIGAALAGRKVHLQLSGKAGRQAFGKRQPFFAPQLQRIPKLFRFLSRQRAPFGDHGGRSRVEVRPPGESAQLFRRNQADRVEHAVFGRQIELPGSRQPQQLLAELQRAVARQHRDARTAVVLRLHAAGLREIVGVGVIFKPGDQLFARFVLGQFRIRELPGRIAPGEVKSGDRVENPHRNRPFARRDGVLRPVGEKTLCGPVGFRPEPAVGVLRAVGQQQAQRPVGGAFRFERGTLQGSKGIGFRRRILADRDGGGDQNADRSDQRHDRDQRDAAFPSFPTACHRSPPGICRNLKPRNFRRSGAGN